MLIGSLVELHVGLHSCLCFSHLEKLLLKAGSTPPRYLLDTQLSIELLQLFLIAILAASRYLVDQSRMGLHPQQLLDTQWIDRASVLDFDELFLDTSAIDKHFLNTSSTDTLIPLDTCICRDLLLVLFQLLCDPVLISIDLSLDTSLFSLPKHSHLTSNFVLQGFFKLFQEFLQIGRASCRERV